MSTPLLKRMKSNGSTFYAFPTSGKVSEPNFSKFVLLNIPVKEESKVMDFDVSTLTSNFGIYTDNIINADNYSDQLVESLRNYIMNQETAFMESNISAKKDFYNIEEPKTPIEKIFWKWLKKMKAIDFEPAEHTKDWNKNLGDFLNENADTYLNIEYFRKYLWKEREVYDYIISDITYMGTVVGLSGSNILKINIEFFAKFKVGDRVTFKGIDTGFSDVYTILKVENISDTQTILYINNVEISGPVDISQQYAYVTLKYKKVVQYIGEINAKSKVLTASQEKSEVIAYIPHQAGQTPTILFEIDYDSNYYPGLEIPILPDQIQTEIIGAENFNSPIRQKPSDYPGLYYGQFDDSNKTYKCSNGDKLRYSGDYFGILLDNNVGINEPRYKESLNYFNSNKLDGICLDFNLNHYLKMSIRDESVGFNFDEFNQLSINEEPPKDFEYNAILWYYDVYENNETTTNLYGITFLNNPINDDDNESGKISTYKKLVSTDEQDGLSYMHVLNISTSVDNDTSSLSFDPLSLNDTFGFDLYSNVMANVGKLNESFINIIIEFTRINSELNNMKSIIYTQTDINYIKNRLKYLEDLLKLYSQYQFINSETVEILPNYSGEFPSLSFNVKGVLYETIIKTKTTSIYDQISVTNDDFIVTTPNTNRLFLRITNDNTIEYGRSINILFSRDLKYKQHIEILLDANLAYYNDNLTFSINFNNDGNNEKTVLLSNIFSPIDIGYIDEDTNELIYHKNKLLTESIKTDIYKTEIVEIDFFYKLKLWTSNINTFGNIDYEETLYINDLKFIPNGGTENDIVDLSGVYKITQNTSDFTNEYFIIDVDFSSYGNPIGYPKVYSYKGLKINILRIDESDKSTLTERYLIEKTFI